MSKDFHDLSDVSQDLQDSQVFKGKSSVQSLGQVDKLRTLNRTISLPSTAVKSANAIAPEPQHIRFGLRLSRRSNTKKAAEEEMPPIVLRKSTLLRSEKKVPIELPSPSKMLSLQSSLVFQDFDKFERPETADDRVNCPICYNDFEESQIVKPLGCQHAFCSHCVSAYLIREIDEFHVLKIKCPQDKCESLFEDQHIQRILNQDAYEIYLNKKFLKLRHLDPNLRYCPKPGCAKAFYPDSRSKTTKCPCGTVICHECFNPSHEGKSCSEANVGEYQMFMGDPNIRKCFMCKTVIDRYIGCAHVLCPVCDYEWCWTCGREWEPGHGSRCLNEWNPIPPKVLQIKKQKNLIDELFNCLFLVFEVITYGLTTALGVIFIWPFAMSKEFLRRLKTRVRNPVAVRILSVFLAIITWPAAVLLYPIKAVNEEYGVCWRRKKRWTKGTAARFGYKGSGRNGGQVHDIENQVGGLAIIREEVSEGIRHDHLDEDLVARLRMQKSSEAIMMQNKMESEDVEMGV